MTTTDTTTATVLQERPDCLHVCADTTPGIHQTDSVEIEWWLPIIGPTATVLAQTLARHTPTGGATWDTAELAQRIGLAGNRSKLWHSLNRLDLFGVARFHATDVLTIRIWLPALHDRQLDRLPTGMADHYRRHFIARPAGGTGLAAWSPKTAGDQAQGVPIHLCWERSEASWLAWLDVAALRAGAVMRRRSLAGQAHSLRSGPSPSG